MCLLSTHTHTHLSILIPHFLSVQFSLCPLFGVVLSSDFWQNRVSIYNTARCLYHFPVSSLSLLSPPSFPVCHHFSQLFSTKLTLFIFFCSSFLLLLILLAGKFLSLSLSLPCLLLFCRLSSIIPRNPLASSTEHILGE